jgi:biotin carboxyl carrier protein
VAGVSADVTTVAGVSADVTTVAADLSGTDTIGTVATNIADVTAVGGSITDVNTAATNIAAIIAAPTEASNAASSASAASTSETNAAASAAKLVGTSVTSITIGTGSKVFTTQSGKQFNVGQYVLIVSDADPTVDFMAGQITAYSGTSLTVDVTSTGGSGAHTDWTIYIAGPVGATGERGATWQGAWATSTAYSVDDVVENEGSSYICILGHTSGASTEPGVGASWETNWELLAQAASPDASIQFVIDGGGSEIVTGVKGYMEVPFACTIQEVRLLADQSGSIVIDIWKDTYANYPPTNADSITASAVPTITSSTKSEDATLTGWTTSLAKGDVLGFNVDSVTTITRVTVVLEVLK